MMRKVRVFSMLNTSAGGEFKRPRTNLRRFDENLKPGAATAGVLIDPARWAD
jgi:hypothetical protein